MRMIPSAPSSEISLMLVPERAALNKHLGTIPQSTGPPDTHWLDGNSPATTITNYKKPLIISPVGTSALFAFFWVQSLFFCIHFFFFLSKTDVKKRRD